MTGNDNEVMRALGRLEAGQENLLNYVKAVSDNQKATAKELEDHKEDTEAHGIKAIRGWITAAGAVIVLLTAIYALWPKGGHARDEHRPAVENFR